VKTRISGIFGGGDSKGKQYVESIEEKLLFTYIIFEKLTSSLKNVFLKSKERFIGHVCETKKEDVLSLQQLLSSLESLWFLLLCSIGRTASFP
jgi:fucose 4-O-acetylase-like acetyltransferase